MTELEDKNYIGFILTKFGKKADIDEIYSKLIANNIDLTKKNEINKFIMLSLDTSESKNKVIYIPKKKKPTFEDLDYLEDNRIADYSRYLSILNPEFKGSLEIIDRILNQLFERKRILILNKSQKNNMTKTAFYLENELIKEIIQVLHTGLWDVLPIELDFIGNATIFNLKFSTRNDIIMSYVNPKSRINIIRNFGKFTANIKVSIYASCALHIYKIFSLPFSNNIMVPFGLESTNILKSNSPGKIFVNYHPYISYHPMIKTIEGKYTFEDGYQPNFCFGNLITLLPSNLINNLPKIMHLIYNLLSEFSTEMRPYRSLVDFTDGSFHKLENSKEAENFMLQMSKLSTNSIDKYTKSMIANSIDLKKLGKIQNCISTKIPIKKPEPRIVSVPIPAIQET